MVWILRSNAIMEAVARFLSKVTKQDVKWHMDCDPTFDISGVVGIFLSYDEGQYIPKWVPYETLYFPGTYWDPPEWDYKEIGGSMGFVEALKVALTRLGQINDELRNQVESEE